MIRRHPDPKIQAAIEAEATRIVAAWPPLTAAELAEVARIFAAVNAETASR